MKSTPFVTIIVPTLNSSGTLPRTLLALENLKYPPDRVRFIVVDGGSTDDTLDVVRKWNKGRIVRVSRGRGEAYDAGIREASGDLVAFVDSDAEPKSEWLHEMIKYFTDRDVAYVTCRVHARPDSTRFQRVADILQSRSIGSACACVYRRAPVVDVEGFDRGLDYYQEDELLGRLERRGYHSVHNPLFLAYHTPRATLMGHLRVSAEQGFWSSKMLLDRHDRRFVTMIARNVAGPLILGLLVTLWWMGQIDILFLLSTLGFMVLAVGLMLYKSTFALNRKLLYVIAAVMLFSLCTMPYLAGLLRGLQESFLSTEPR